MSQNVKTINIIFCIADMLVRALAILSFAWCAKYFERWWISLFSLLPLFMYNARTFIIEDALEDEDGES